MNYATPDLLENAETSSGIPDASSDDIAGGATFTSTSADLSTVSAPIDEIEQLTIEQAAVILGVPEQKVRALIEDDTLCCSDTDENNEPRLNAACVRAQAGKSKLEFIELVKSLIAGENSKKRTRSVDLPLNADACLQELFDSDSPFSQRQDAPLEVPAASVEAPQKMSRVENAIAKQQSSHDVHVRGIDRAEITSKNIAAVLENLDFTSVRLEGAMYRIGYLEAKLDDKEKELQIMPELRAKWAKSLILERENEDYRKASEEYKETVARRERELLDLHQLLNKIKESWWCRLWCWLSGTPLV